MLPYHQGAVVLPARGKQPGPASCKACAHMVGHSMAEKLLVDSGRLEAVPTACERLLRKRSDEVDPILTFRTEVSIFPECE